jgi:hypothetical protein
MYDDYFEACADPRPIPEFIAPSKSARPPARVKNIHCLRLITIISIFPFPAFNPTSM